MSPVSRGVWSATTVSSRARTLTGRRPWRAAAVRWEKKAVGPAARRAAKRAVREWGGGGAGGGGGARAAVKPPGGGGESPPRPPPPVDLVRREAHRPRLLERDRA